MMLKFKQNPDERNQESQRIKRETDRWWAEATKPREVERYRPDVWRSAFVAAEIGGGGRRCLVEEGGGKSFGGFGERVEGKGLVVGGGASDSYQLDGGGRLW
jgi:hypothetical protein